MPVASSAVAARAGEKHPAAPADADAAAVAIGQAALDRGDLVAARNAFAPLAEKGNAEAQFQLALLLGDGKGGPADVGEAIRLLRGAARQDHLRAQATMSVVLGNDAAASHMTPEEAVQWVTRAATRGHAVSVEFLADLYEKDPRFRDPVQATHWGELAIDNAIASARRRNEAEMGKIRQRLGEIDQALEDNDAKRRQNQRRQRELAIELRDDVLAGRAQLGRTRTALGNLRAQQLRLHAMYDEAYRDAQQAIHDDIDDGPVRMQRIRAVLDGNQQAIAKAEAGAPALLGLRLAGGQVAVMRDDGRYVVLDPVPGGAIDPASLPRAGDWLLPQALEPSLVEYEQAWSGVPDAGAQTTLDALNALIGEFQCDKKVFGYPLSHRNTELGDALALDVHGVLRARYQLGNGNAATWSEQETYMPLARVGRVEVQPGGESACTAVQLRCIGSRSCATSYGTEIAVTPALTLYFATSDEAVDAVSLLERMRGR